MANRKPRKLTDEQVRAIRDELGTHCCACGHKRTYRDIGAAFGVTQVTVHNIATGKSRMSA